MNVLSDSILSISFVAVVEGYNVCIALDFRIELKLFKNCASIVLVISVINVEACVCRFGAKFLWMDALEHQIRPSAPSSVISRPTCFSSSLHCCWQVGSAPFVRRGCDCSASSAPFTNIQTYLLTYS